MKFYNFDLLAYPRLDNDAPRTPVPSNYFDPKVGWHNYQEHIDEMAHCEPLGFDGVVFNEHHYSAYGTMPSPNLIAAALSQRTSRIRIGVLGNILPLRSHPVRVAEEYAMLDCMTGGRLIAGFVRGVPAEYVWYNVDPTESRGRFEEAYDLIKLAGPSPCGAIRVNSSSSRTVRSGHGRYSNLIRPFGSLPGARRAWSGAQRAVCP